MNKEHIKRYQSMKQFCYHEPKTIKETCSLLSQYGEQARVLAGGTDLIPKIKNGLAVPGHVVNIKKIPSLEIIEERENGLRIGALVLISEITNNSLIRNRFPILGTAAASIGSLQVRNLATIGGNICNAAPSADMAPGLLALDSTVKIAGVEGHREISLEEFFLGPGKVALGIGEILTEIDVPFLPPNAKQVYLKHTVRRAMDIAVVGVAVCLSFEEKTSHCKHARIALGAVAPTPIRAKKTEQMILGKKLEDINLDSIQEMVRMEVAPISDVRGSANYRSEIVSMLTARAIKSLGIKERINGETC
jgi:CO/xanthine dehydrogenase FAD-binding subunit